MFYERKKKIKFISGIEGILIFTVGPSSSSSSSFPLSTDGMSVRNKNNVFFVVSILMIVDFYWSRYYDIVKADRQNKGTILKASVDFIKEMKKELTQLRGEVGSKKSVELENLKLRTQVQVRMACFTVK